MRRIAAGRREMRPGGAGSIAVYFFRKKRSISLLAFGPRVSV